MQWDKCNNMVISRIHNNIFENIKFYVLFITTEYEIWKQLEKRFLLTNGSRKYKLNKDFFSLKQNGMKISDYFTTMGGLWEEIESMNILSAIATMTPEIINLLKAIKSFREESKLFQFLNGLDETYGAQTSQLLMMCPLPSIETACAPVQQEESQKEILSHTSLGESNVMAMYSKGAEDKILQCKCWETTGYPKWNYKFKPGAKKLAPGKWSSSEAAYSKMANNTQGGAANQQEIMMTSQ